MFDRVLNTPLQKEVIQPIASTVQKTSFSTKIFFSKLEQIHNVLSSFQVATPCRFNIYKTSATSYRRLINAETTSCAQWVQLFSYLLKKSIMENLIFWSRYVHSQQFQSTIFSLLLVIVPETWVGVEERVAFMP